MTESERIEIIRNSTRDIVQHLGYLNNLFAYIGSVSQCYALHKLEKNRLTPQELSAELGLDRSTISRLAKDLVDKGYCAYLANDKDRRSRYLEPTELGRQKLNEIHSTAIRQVQSALQHLNREEKDLIANGLSLYARALKSSPEIGDQNG